MNTNKSPDRNSVLCTMQREQERERRRMRDRQRRESMTPAEREKHLARRRKNYQLRRQKAGNGQSGSDGDQAFLASAHEQITRHEPQPMTAALDFSVGQSSGAIKVFVVGRNDLSVRGTTPIGQKLSIFNRKLRLSHVRHLARSLDCSKRKLIATYIFSKGAVSSNCANPRKLRVTQVKCLARELESSIKDLTGQIHQLTTENLFTGGQILTSQESLQKCASPLDPSEPGSSKTEIKPPMLMVNPATSRKERIYKQNKLFPLEFLPELAQKSFQLGLVEMKINRMKKRYTAQKIK